jgi:hypothetical protein
MHKILSVSLLTAVVGIGALYACPFCDGKKQEAFLAPDPQQDLDEDTDIDNRDEDIDEDIDDTDDMDIGSDDNSDLDSGIDDEDEQG